MASKKKTSKKSSKKTAQKTAQKSAPKSSRKASAQAPGKAAAPKRTAKAKAAPREARPAVSRAARIEALAKIFEQLGARNPAQWASQHVEDDSDQLGRFMLLRALWLRIVEPGRVIGLAVADPAVGEVFNRLMKAASIADLDALVRYAQRAALDDLCRVLDDPATNDDGVRWGVFRVDAGGAPLWPLTSLRKGLADTEP